MQIKFCGYDGTILEKSPHGNYLVVELTYEITICGTFSNKWNWLESPEIQSGFISFITYIGVDCNTNLSEIHELIEKLGGYFKVTESCDESLARPSKRNQHYPLELKVRGLSAEAVVQLIEYFK